jgi:hypothetical protein
VASLLAFVGAWVWAVKSISQPRTKGSARVERGLHISAVVAVLLAGGIFLYIAVSGLLSGEVIAGRRIRASVELAPMVYWSIEAFWFSLAALMFYGALRRHKRVYVEP